MRALLALKVASSLQPRRVLEVAAGDGALCAALNSTLGCEVWANDLRGENLQRALGSFVNGPSVGRLPGNLFQLNPGDTGLFDLVIACEVIEHVAHTIEFMRTLRGFISPGGRLLLTTPNGAYFRNKLPTYSEIQDFRALEPLQFKPDADGHLFLITPQELAHLADTTGFEIERIDLWGTPAITGYCGFRLFSRLGSIWPWYTIEKTFLKAPNLVREKLSFALSAVLRLRET